MLTEEGKEVALECLLRSGLTDPNKSLHNLEKRSNLNPSDLLRVEDLPASDCDIVASCEKVVQPSTNLKKQKILHVPPEYLEKVCVLRCKFGKFWLLTFPTVSVLNDVLVMCVYYYK